MRRLVAFITLAIAMISVALVGIPSISKTLNSGVEFDGGCTILYEVTDSEGIAYSGLKNESVMKDVTERMNSRLNALNVSFPEVSIEGENEVRVTVPKGKGQELSYIRYALLNNAQVTLRDFNDTELCKGEDVFSSVKLVLVQDVVYVQCKCKNNEAKEILKEATSKALNVTTDDGQGNQVAGFVIWLGFEDNYTDLMKDLTGFDNDSFNNAQYNSYTAFKIIASISLTSAIEDDFSVQSNTVDASNLPILNNILRDHSVKYVVSEKYTAVVGSIYNENTPTVAIVCLLVAILLVGVLMIVNYKLAGVASLLSIFVNAVVVLLGYSLFGGLFGAETFIALVIAIGLSVDANVTLLERVKDEIRKGKSVSRSFEEGSKKSVSSIFDLNILIIIASLALYLAGNQIVKSFAAILLISEVSILLIVVLLTRLMLSLLCNSSLFEGHPERFGVSEEKALSNNLYNGSLSLFDKIQNVKDKKVVRFASLGVIGLGVVVGLLCVVFGGSFLNTNSRLGKGTRIYFETVNPEFATVEQVNEFFKDEEMASKKPVEVIISTDTILNITDAQVQEYSNEFNRFGLENPSNDLQLYSVLVTFDKKLDNTSFEAIESYFNEEKEAFYDYDEDEGLFKTNFSINEYKSYNGGLSALNAFFAVSMMLVFAGLYILIRFSASYCLTAICSIFIEILLVLGVCSITRLDFGVETSSAIIASIIMTLANFALTFDRLRENVSENTNIVWDVNSRQEFITKSMKQTLLANLSSMLSVSVATIILFIVLGVKLMNLNAILLIGVIASFFVTFFVMPTLWVEFDTLVAKIKENRKVRLSKKTKFDVDEGDSKEYTFFGIND